MTLFNTMRDQNNATPVMLPGSLARKYPEYRFAWSWAWLFAAHRPCRHPRIGTVVRCRMHEVRVQRAVRQARRQLGICVLPHELRHGYATHCLEQGANPRAIQEAMCHKSLETTMGCLHTESLSVRSLLETVFLQNAGETLPPGVRKLTSRDASSAPAPGAAESAFLPAASIVPHTFRQ